ncbi:hypothetical protein M409DRAFT_66199 [Zasmidium cellare ATCC 36951]|uniref:Amine oxidase n=1 Tax=Zasmidium cellare ATCC 36951 TaxID=1080233 RepID=A0A6A6CLW7_ZASCE|nr:uncharacterized protein M409DRAFT_66199 [Zasmidium cellare ATCC 36951]KAF2167150.1 hypothetical protein M409DRAFT_66199 [Zasmidium cellare ATCC 36951]
MPRPTFFDPSDLPTQDLYSQGVHFDGPNRTVIAAGQVGILPNGSIPQDSRKEVQQALLNVDKVLQAGGATIRDLVKLTILVVDFDYENAKILAEPIVEFLQTTYGVTARPTMTLILVPKLAVPQARFEVEATAVLPGKANIWREPEQQKGIPEVSGSLQCDVVVVGAGFSGIQAAADLHEAGLKVLVLEAKSRIGGRPLGWINKTTQPKIYALTQKFGLEVYRQYEVADLLQLIEALEKAQSEIDGNNPSAASKHHDISVEDWLQTNNFSEWAKQTMRHFTAAIVGRESRDLGLHYVLDYIKSGNGYLSLASEGEDGAQSLKVKQGTSAIAHGLARTLPPGSVLLNSPVQSIVQHAKRRVIVETTAGLAVQCSKVVVAIPTQTYDKIHFTPPLPLAKRAIVTRTQPAVYIKIILTYARPWWRELGLVGSFFSVKGPINFSWDTSDKAAGKHYSLALFSHGDSAASLGQLSSLQRETAVLEHLVELVGEEHRGAVLDVAEINQKEWLKEEYIEGGPTSTMRTGDYAKYSDALREVFGHIHFAGGELAYDWKGYLEGALRSGSRCAAEVVEDVKKAPVPSRL